jgi:hypothetical protein
MGRTIRFACIVERPMSMTATPCAVLAGSQPLLILNMNRCWASLDPKLENWVVRMPAQLVAGYFCAAATVRLYSVNFSNCFMRVSLLLKCRTSSADE